MRKINNCVYAILFFILVSCGSDDSSTPQPSTDTYEATININPNNFPAGGALNLTLDDIGKVAQLDVETTFDWDIKIIAYRTSQGGRPGVFLFGDSESTSAVKAVNVSELAQIGLGDTGFDEFTRVTVAMQEALQPDDVFGFDPLVDVDIMGNPDLTLLEAAYQNLVIGDKIVNLPEADQPVFLVRSKGGVLFKFQLVRRENGGDTLLRWSRFGQDAID